VNDPRVDMKLNVQVLSAFGDEVGSGIIILGDHTESPYAEPNTELIASEARYAIPAGKTRLSIPSTRQRQDIAWSIIIEPED
jgi:hypothetical protein